MSGSRINNYIELLQEQKKFDKIKQENRYVHEAALMLTKLREAKRAHVRNELGCKGIQVVVGSQYYRGEKFINEVIEEHTEGDLKVKIDHYDHWSGDDHDVAHILVPVKDVGDKKEMKAAFKKLKAWAPNVELSVSFEETW